jgi:hypothetical protein
MAKIKLQISAVFHSRHNPFEFLVDSETNEFVSLDNKKTIPKDVLDVLNGKKLKVVSDHSLCDGSELLKCF